MVVEETKDMELTTEELKMAFRWLWLQLNGLLDPNIVIFRIFDQDSQGYIGVGRFREILREIDEMVSDDELDRIIEYVSQWITCMITFVCNVFCFLLQKEAHYRKDIINKMPENKSKLNHNHPI